MFQRSNGRFILHDQLSEARYQSDNFLMNYLSLTAGFMS